MALRAPVFSVGCPDGSGNPREIFLNFEEELCFLIFLVFAYFLAFICLFIIFLGCFVCCSW